MARKKVFSIGVLILIVPLFILIFKDNSAKTPSDNVFKTDINEHILCRNPEKKFEIIVDSFDIASERIRRNQNLANILKQYDFGDHSVYDILQQIDKVFDVTKFKSGNPYHVFYDKYDTTGTVSYLVYEHEPTSYLKLSFGEKITARKLEKETRVERKTRSATIRSSLWNTMKDNELNPLLAVELSEIYAWTIDFFGLNTGDAFKVIYEEEYVDSTSIGIKNIVAAYFEHKQDTFYAIPFEQDSALTYYDREGKSLQREFLKAPLKFSRISSGYSQSRMHPILKRRRPHRGVDYAAPAGTPIHAIGDGVVIDKGYTKAAGYYIKIRHNSIYTTGYNHLSGYAKGMQKGSKVKQGDVIGYVGATGYATGPHLDFRFRKNGQLVDPLKIEAPPVKPVEEENLEAFGQAKEKWLKELHN
ncbi:MAG: peptidoglycan DD-metalloendopeptidase family protein [Bacteroidales bacterium]